MTLPTDSPTVDLTQPDYEDYPNPSDPRNDLWGHTIRESASRVLCDAQGGWLHYREVAKRAFARGYRTNRMNSTERVIEKSFFDTMRRQGDLERSGPLFRIPPA